MPPKARREPGYSQHKGVMELVQSPAASVTLEKPLCLSLPFTLGVLYPTRVPFAPGFKRKSTTHKSFTHLESSLVRSG